MKKCIIYCFSGTNNTKMVCDMLGENLKEHNYDVTIIPINCDITERNLQDTAECDLLGIAYPVYAFGASRIIYDFIKKLPQAHKKKTFILKTAGGYTDINRNSSYKVIKKLESKGYKVEYDRLIVMPSNFYMNYGDRLTKNLYQTALEKTRHIAEDLAQGTVLLYIPALFISALTNFINFMEDCFGARTYGLSLHVNKDCIKCMKCVNGCPNNNIKLNNDKIKIGTNCLFCMKCVYNCPVDAIKSRGYNFCVLKDGYDIDKIITDDGIEPMSLEEIKIGKLNSFYDYFDKIEN